MKFDMKTIDRLMPSGLLDLGVLERLISYLLGLVEVEIVRETYCTQQILKLSRLIGRLSKQHRDNRNYNLNLKVKAWVLADGLRIKRVRHVIGEAAIRRWQRQYADLQSGHALANVEWKLKLKPIPKQNTISNRSYAWKRFVLGDVYMFRDKPYKLSRNLIISLAQKQSLCAWAQPREKRILKPVEFWPHELALGNVPEPEYMHQETCQKENKESVMPPPKTRWYSRSPQKRSAVISTESKPP